MEPRPVRILGPIPQAACGAFVAGLSVFPPAEDGSKGPTGSWKRFQTARLSPEAVSTLFARRTGLCVVCGAVSGNLEALDFDDRPTYEAFLELAHQAELDDIVRRLELGYVEDTPSGGVHWLYRCDEISGSRKLAQRPTRPEERRDGHDKFKTLIETRGEGAYCIVAPSHGHVHPSGRPYVLRVGGFATIPTLTPTERRELHGLARTFDECVRRVETGSAVPPHQGGDRPGDEFNARARWSDVLVAHGWSAVYTRNDTTYWRRPGKPRGVSATTNHGGSDYLIVFSTSTPFDTGRAYSKFTAFAILAHGGDFSAAARELWEQGYGRPLERAREPATAAIAGPFILDPADPVPSARAFINQTYTAHNDATLKHLAGAFYAYDPEVSAYRELDESTLRAGIYAMLETCQRKARGSKGGASDGLLPFQPNKAKVDNVVDALRALTSLPTGMVFPCWLRDGRGLDPWDLMACQNGLLHVPTRTLYPPTPTFFTLQGLGFPYDAGAPEPRVWTQFLQELWGDDPEAIQTLQEAFGYALTPRTHLQKIFMVVGPKRSGKGTIARVLRRLLGERNCCGPTLASLGEQFGLASLIGKALAIISDARIGGRTDTAVLSERLLSISGEDAISIPRKFLPDWSGKLPTRFWLLSNELPKIEDGSGALASRFIVLRLTQSFYGREDQALIDKLASELPGILNWALGGHDRLYARGRFVQPESAQELVEAFEDLGSPIGTFIRERCETAPEHEVRADTLYAVWKEWCADVGREKPGTIQTLGRNLRAAVPWLDTPRPTVLGQRVRYFRGIRLRKEDE